MYTLYQHNIVVNYRIHEVLKTILIAYTSNTQDPYSEDLEFIKNKIAEASGDLDVEIKDMCFIN